MGYDVFLSHNYADKVWTRELYDRLARTEYNGRMLRAWLDERVLDPGNPASKRELESALDRSRFLAVVLSPEALNSTWVMAEITYFLGTRQVADVIVIRRRPCQVPSQLDKATLIDWPEGDAAPQKDQILHLLCPNAEDSIAQYEFRKKVRRAWERARFQQPDGLYPTPTEENARLLELLLSYDIGDPDEEGSAVVAFERVGQLVSELSLREGYGLKMVLGEFLAIAMLRDVRYGRVSAKYVEQDFSTYLQGPSFNTWRNRALSNAAGPPSTTNLLFSVARANSKLAEVDPSRIDLSTTSAVLHRLDQRSTISGEESSVAGMIGRSLGKLRGTAVVDVLIHALSRWGGIASGKAAAGAISGRFDDDSDLLYYTTELARLRAAAQSVRPLHPPSALIAQLLLDKSSPLWLRQEMRSDIENARSDLIRFFGADWPSANAASSGLRETPQPTKLENGPLVGTVHRITRSNMESHADRLGPMDVAWLTEPRIVDALFEGVSGYIIAQEEAEGPLGVRLHGRGARFAAFGTEAFEQLESGMAIALWPGRTENDAQGLMLSPN
jgi:hypothetical protein